MARKKKAPKGMMSVYPPLEVAPVLGGYRSLPFTMALRIASQVLGDSAVEVATRFSPEEWEVMRTVFTPREWEPEVPNPGDMLADALVRAHVRVHVGHIMGKTSKEGDKRIESLAQKLRAASYLDVWAVLIALTWRSQREVVEPGDAWWTIAYRAAKMEDEKPEKDG